MKAVKKNKQKVKTIIMIILIFIMILDLMLLVRVTYFRYFEVSLPINPKIEIKDNKLIVSFYTNEYQLNNTTYCIIKTDNKEPNINDEWVLSKNNSCVFDIEENIYKVYLKSSNDKIIYIKNSDKVGSITDIKSNKDKIYLAIDDTYSPTLTILGIGNIDRTVKWSSSNEDIATVNENGLITGKSKGEVNIIARAMDKEITINVLVTDLIVKRPNKFNNSKSYLPCGKYSEKENDLLDTILEDRINTVGYKTRAGAVEAARFLALEFPYKIRYFSENGRKSTNGVEGEGRYYNKGLYLHSSRFKNINKKAYGPATWGCSLYSRPSHGKRSNGLDCSGFVSWVLLNGGFDVGDVGAGLASHLDLTDYGVRTKFNASVISSGKVKVGDLLSSGGVNGGHIAIIVGEDNNYYYVAESLWTPPNVSVTIIGYSKKTIFNRYYYVMLMDSYYKEDGKLTDLWY